MDIRFMNRLNPFYKAVTILVAGLVMTFSYLLCMNLAICAGCLVLLLFFSRIRIRSMLQLMVPALFAALCLFMTGLLRSSGGGEEAYHAAFGSYTAALQTGVSLYNALQLGTRVLAFAMLGILFALTTDSELFIQSLMHQCHLRPKFAYGILAAFHLMPHIGEEYRNARLAYRARGMHTRWFSLRPLFTSMVSCIRWSGNVAMAMESKGFDENGSRTYYQVTTAGIPDAAFFVLLIGALVAGRILLPY